MAVMLSNKGNAMATAAAVRERMDELQKFFPGDMKWDAPYDTSKFVSISIKKVVQTLAEAILLVFVVMFLFLQNIRYTLIPTIVAPISLLGAFACLQYLGMSINVLTMFAMVLVIGIVVDDAIVVVENVERIMSEEGLPPKEATKKAMSQISGAVIGITAGFRILTATVLYRRERQDLYPICRHHGDSDCLLGFLRPVADPRLVRHPAQTDSERAS